HVEDLAKDVVERAREEGWLTLHPRDIDNRPCSTRSTSSDGTSGTCTSTATAASTTSDASVGRRIAGGAPRLDRPSGTQWGPRLPGRSRHPASRRRVSSP